MNWDFIPLASDKCTFVTKTNFGLWTTTNWQLEDRAKKLILKDKIFIGDRVRDLIYDKINDRVILTLEDQESIGIINLNNKK